MLVVISPAKKLDWSDVDQTQSEPEFAREANRLAAHGRALTLGKLKGLMDLSDDLARLNRERFRAFEESPAREVTRPAAYAFAGDTYVGLDVRSFSAEALDWAKGNLRILSGLYGLLRPLDAIQPYRLEMGSRLKTRRGSNLYDFWGDEIARALNVLAEERGTEVLVNCASQEYFGAVDLKRLRARVITPVFLEEKDGKAKTVSFFAKQARGAMARFMAENRVSRVEDLRGFDLGGYRFDADRSGGDDLVFIRDYPAAKAA